MEFDAKAVLHEYLQSGREVMLWKLEGLSEYDKRRPLVPTATNLLGLVRHVASSETGDMANPDGSTAHTACLEGPLLVREVTARRVPVQSRGGKGDDDLLHAGAAPGFEHAEQRREAPPVLDRWGVMAVEQGEVVDRHRAAQRDQLGELG